MSNKLRIYLRDKLNKINIILSVPGALKARRKGIYFALYKMLYTLKAMRIKPNTILDIGAHRGMFSKAAHYLYPSADIIAFEPLSDCFKDLLYLSNSIKEIECYNYALGESDHETVIHKNNYDYSSSILKMSDKHKIAFPYARISTEEKIKVKRLDKVLSGEKLKKPVLLKIDVQGYERSVIKGAMGIMNNIDVIICELSFFELYEEQPLFDEMHALFIKLGFTFMGYVGDTRNQKNGQLLQIDALFMNREVHNLIMNTNNI